VIRPALGGHRGNSGFSLLEVLIAMAVLTVGAGSLIALFAAASSTHRRSVDRTRAALVADEIVAQAQLLYSPDVKPEDLDAAMKTRLPELIGDYRWEIKTFHPQGEGWTEAELWVHIAIRWRRSGKAREEEFDTVLLPRDVGVP